MPKRFHDTDIWSEDWFISLEPDYQKFWFYVKDKCDHAGIWRPNVEVFNRVFRGQVDLNIALKMFNQDVERIAVLPSGRWFLIGFIPFQYGAKLNMQNRLHYSIYQILNHFEVNLTSIRPQLEVIDRVKDKDSISIKDLGFKKGVQGETKQFIPPTLEEVSAYCLERKNGIDPESFISYYQANGWVQGKGKPIVDWKSAMITWEKKRSGGFSGGKKQPSKNRAAEIENLLGGNSAG